MKIIYLVMEESYSHYDDITRYYPRMAFRTKEGANKYISQQQKPFDFHIEDIELAEDSKLEQVLK